jgi:hypothetical protein
MTWPRTSPSGCACARAEGRDRERVEWAGKMLDLTPYLDRRPKELSGGQRQRVAMGRAIVRQPQAFLMDEPLSNLDAKLRVQMRADIAKLQRDLGTTTIYVTHDQVEAMSMGKRTACRGHEPRASCSRGRNNPAAAVVTTSLARREGGTWDKISPRQPLSSPASYRHVPPMKTSAWRRIQIAEYGSVAHDAVRSAVAFYPSSFFFASAPRPRRWRTDPGQYAPASSGESPVKPGSSLVLFFCSLSHSGIPVRRISIRRRYRPQRSVTLPTPVRAEASNSASRRSRIGDRVRAPEGRRGRSCASTAALSAEEPEEEEGAEGRHRSTRPNLVGESYLGAFDCGRMKLQRRNPTIPRSRFRRWWAKNVHVFDQVSGAPLR